MTAPLPALALGLGLSSAALCALASGSASASSRAAEPETLFIQAQRVVVRPGHVLSDAQVVVEDGVILRVGQGLEKPAGATEVSGAVVCAGFIDTWSTLGVTRGSSEDRNVASTLTLDAVDVYDQDHAFTEALAAGVTAVRAQSGDKANVGGIGAVLRLDPAGARDEVVVLEDAALQASLCLTVNGRVIDVLDRPGAVDKLVGEITSGRKYRQDWIDYEVEYEEWRKEIADAEEELEKDFKKAKKDRDKAIKKAAEDGKEHKEKKYKEDKQPKRPKVDPDRAAFARVANGDVPLVVQVYRHAELRDLLARTAEFDRLRLIVAGGADALAHSETLDDRDIPVIVWPSPTAHTLGNEFEDYDLGLAGALADEGVEVLIGSGGASSARDLPLLARIAVGHGLDAEKAFEALTLGAARAFDVADRLGSVELGKDADLLILDGEPLAPGTRVQAAIVAGRIAYQRQ